MANNNIENENVLKILKLGAPGEKIEDANVESIKERQQLLQISSVQDSAVDWTAVASPDNNQQFDILENIKQSWGEVKPFEFESTLRNVDLYHQNPLLVFEDPQMNIHGESEYKEPTLNASVIVQDPKTKHYYQALLHDGKTIDDLHKCFTDTAPNIFNDVVKAFSNLVIAIYKKVPIRIEIGSDVELGEEKQSKTATLHEVPDYTPARPIDKGGNDSVFPPKPEWPELPDFPRRRRTTAPIPDIYKTVLRPDYTNNESKRISDEDSIDDWEQFFNRHLVSKNLKSDSELIVDIPSNRDNYRRFAETGEDEDGKYNEIPEDLPGVICKHGYNGRAYLLTISDELPAHQRRQYVEHLLGKHEYDSYVKAWDYIGEVEELCYIMTKAPKATFSSPQTNTLEIPRTASLYESLLRRLWHELVFAEKSSRESTRLLPDSNDTLSQENLDRLRSSYIGNKERLESARENYLAAKQDAIREGLKISDSFDKISTEANLDTLGLPTLTVKKRFRVLWFWGFWKLKLVYIRIGPFGLFGWRRRSIWVPRRRYFYREIPIDAIQEPELDYVKHLEGRGLKVIEFEHDITDFVEKDTGVSIENYLQQCDMDDSFRQETVFMLPRTRMERDGREYIESYAFIFRPLPSRNPNRLPSLELATELAYSRQWLGTELDGLVGMVNLAPGEKRRISLHTEETRTESFDSKSSLGVSVSAENSKSFKSEMFNATRKGTSRGKSSSSGISLGYGGLGVSFGSGKSKSVQSSSEKLKGQATEINSKFSRSKKIEVTTSIANSTSVTRSSSQDIEINNINQGKALNLAFYQTANVFGDIISKTGLFWRLRGYRELVKGSEQYPDMGYYFADLRRCVEDIDRYPNEYLENVGISNTEAKFCMLHSALSMLAKDYLCLEKDKERHPSKVIVVSEIPDEWYKSIKDILITDDDNNIENVMTIWVETNLNTFEELLQDYDSGELHQVSSIELREPSNAIFMDSQLGFNASTEQYSEDMRALELRSRSLQNDNLKADTMIKHSYANQSNIDTLNFTMYGEDVLEVGDVVRRDSERSIVFNNSSAIKGNFWLIDSINNRVPVFNGVLPEALSVPNALWNNLADGEIRMVNLLASKYVIVQKSEPEE